MGAMATVPWKLAGPVPAIEGNGQAVLRVDKLDQAVRCPGVVPSQEVDARPLARPHGPGMYNWPLPPIQAGRLERSRLPCTQIKLLS